MSLLPRSFDKLPHRSLRPLSDSPSAPPFAPLRWETLRQNEVPTISLPQQNRGDGLERPYRARATFIRRPGRGKSPTGGDETQSVTRVSGKHRSNFHKKLTIRQLLAELGKIEDAARVSRGKELDTRMWTRREQEIIEELHRRRDGIDPDRNNR